MRRHIFFSIILFFTITINAQNYSNDQRPKLVVGIVVDQMRYDYLTRFYDKYGEGGFKRLLNEGFSCENAHFNYIPTATAVGHASIYTGAKPSAHGIINNYWYDKLSKKSIYCVDDASYKTVGAEEGGEKSPHRLIVTTITDELQLAQNFQGKTISVSIKDRSAILPAGHTANGAYWFQGATDGKFITSTYYMEELPKWVNKFNESGIVKKYMKKKWKTFYDIDTYTESIDDNNSFEKPFNGKETPTFPYDLSKLAELNGNYDMIKSTPFGNSIVADFAKEAIDAEKLGKDSYTDFLAISFSSPDYIGHQFGVDSKEVEDTYIRLDKDLEALINYLDEKVGVNNYTLFLTADHGAVPVPAYLQSKKIPSGYIDNNDFKGFIIDITKKYFNSDALIESYSNSQLFLDKAKIRELNLETHKVARILADEIINYKSVWKTVTAEALQNDNFKDGVLSNLKNGYNQRLSGDVFIIHNPGVISYPKTGSTHLSGFNHDTHIPIIFYGKGIKKGLSKSYTPITDITPTLANLLNVAFPNGNSGKIIEKALK